VRGLVLELGPVAQGRVLAAGLVVAVAVGLELVGEPVEEQAQAVVLEPIVELVGALGLELELAAVQPLEQVRAPVAAGLVRSV